DKKEGGRKVKAEDRRVYKVGFWNVAGVKNKDEDFWTRLEEWDVLCKFLSERGWAIANGSIKGDEEGEWTFVGERGCSVIASVLSNNKLQEKIMEVKVEERVESDHMPVVAGIRVKRDRSGGRRKRAVNGTTRGIWSKESTRKFEEEFKEWDGVKSSVEEDWQELKEKSRRAIKVTKKFREKKSGKSSWWDEECRKEKINLRKTLQKFRREVWKVVNEGRKRRKQINKDINMKEWDAYVKELLGGTEERKSRKEEEGDISLEEIRETVKSLKDNKAMGEDGILNEAWKYGGEKIEIELWRICQRVWRGEGWPEDWKKGVVVPIVKKGEGRKVEEYRGVTLTQTAYKVYVGILENRMRIDVEKMGLLPESQAGFRRGRGTIDNIYVLNYLINREITKIKGKTIVFYVDFKAAFDSVDRGKLCRALRKRGEGRVSEEMQRGI
ncbi:GSCOCG00012085001-RA-CDS, partial [Cotesia congregata]